MCAAFWFFCLGGGQPTTLNMEKFMNRFFVLLFTLLMIGSVQLFAQNGNESGCSQVNSFFESALKTYNLAAISACIIKDNKLSWSNAFGYADYDTG